jgi:hypothetical protein
MWYNKYVGIPYTELGRDKTGVDCWGLARLVYREEFGTELPDFSELYTTTSDQDLTSSLIEQYRDGWELVQDMVPGDLVCFRILGHISHIGIYVGDSKFIHAREGIDQVVVESLNSTQWQHRVAGFYRYTKPVMIIANAAPHPLKYQRISAPIVVGTTVLEAVSKINTTYQVPSELEANYVVVLNGKPLAYDSWAGTRIAATDTLEYRALARGGGARQLLMLAVVIAATIYAPGVADSVFGETAFEMATGEVATIGASKAAVIGTQIGLTMAGMALVNMIAPIRPPSAGETDTEGKRASLFGGGSNQSNPYGAIPVVLGKTRITPYLGAQQWVDFIDSERNYLNTLVVWGFGPLKISDICIGTQPIGQYTDYNIATLEGYPGENTTAIDNIYGNDVLQRVPNHQLVNIDPNNNPNNIASESLNPWSPTQLINQVSNRLSVALHFPEGLRQLVIQGQGAGDINAATFTGEIQYRKTSAAWPSTTAQRSYASINFQVPNANYSYIDYTSYNAQTGAYNYISTNLYQWVRFGITDAGNPVILYGHPTESQNSEPSESLKTAIKTQGYTNLIGGSIESTRLPSVPSWMRLLWTVCVYGTSGIVQTIDNRASLGITNTGFDLTTQNITDTYYDYGTGTTSSVTTGTSLTIATGTLGAATNNLNSGSVLVSLGAEGESFYKKKDAFTHVVNITGIDPGEYEVRVKRTNYDTLEPSTTLRNYHTAILYTITGYSNTKPIVNPTNCTLAKTALSILASDSVNGRLEGINGLVQSVCFDYDYTIATVADRWKQKRATSNPASLFLHVLTHPANLFRVGDTFYTGSIDIDAFSAWHDYCRQQGFEYNGILDTQRSVLEVLRDIASAGRASPMVIDGKWTIIIDKIRPSVVQHFTPYNSWGFESTKVLPRRPHAFKVVFKNEEKAYQDDEIIVPNEGYTSQTATFIEQISLPGITSRAAAAKHARFHLAQLKLRPEVYTLNSDFEYLVCNRGDLVRVTHDIPMWGTGFGRLKTITSSTELVLDQPVYLESGVAHTIRIRTSSGTSVTRQLSNVAVGQYYTTITLASALTGISVGDLYMLGTLNAESEELVVISIEPTGNTSARLTLVDYSSEIYSVDTNTLDPSVPFQIPKYNTNITTLPEFLLETVTTTPIVDTTKVRSDEAVLTRLSNGTVITNMQVPFKNSSDLPKTVSYVEIQYDFNLATATQFQFTEVYALNTISNSILVENLQDGVTYKYRLRYLTDTRINGPWSDTYTHTVIGKTTRPSSVQTFQSSLNSDTGNITLSWSSIPELDLAYYEIRTIDSGWGTSNGIVFKGLANSCITLPYNVVEASNSYFIRAYDLLDNYSLTSAQTNITVQRPATPILSGNFIANLFAQSTLTDSIYNFTWEPGIEPANSLRVDKYNVVLETATKTITTTTNSLSWQTNASWLGNATFKVQAVDILGNTSTWLETIVSKIKPATPSSPTLTPVGTNLRFEWPAVSKTSLPIVGYELRTSDSGWGGAGSVWKGSVTTADIDLKGKTPGVYTWYLRAFDSDSQYSETRTVQYTLSAPQSTTINNPVFQDTSLTNATVTINWAAVTPTFGLAGYEVNYTYDNKRYGEPGEPATKTSTIKANSNSITIPGNWLGDTTVYVTTIDLLGNSSNAASKTVTIQAPNPPINISPRVVDNTVLLSWEYPEITTFPVETIRLKQGGTNWADATLIGDKTGTFTVVTELAKGTYTYRFATIDTEGNESQSVSIIADVRQPPDYVFIYDWTSTFSGTKTNAVIEPNTQSLIFPVNTTETWTQHFTTPNWTSPQDQVNAGYPIYIQPGLSTGSYQETFDYGQTIGSSLISVSTTGQSLQGTVNISTQIEYSNNNSTWTSAGTSISTFGQNFRYIRVTLSAVQQTAGAIYSLSSLKVRLDVKEIKDSGTASVTSSDPYGTSVNFTKEFLDVKSIIVTPKSTLGYFAVYDYRDDITSASYSKNGTTGIATITINNNLNYSSVSVQGVGGAQIEVTVPAGHGLQAGDSVRISTNNITQYSTGSTYKAITIISSTVFRIAQSVATTTVDNTCQIYASISNRVFRVSDTYRISFSADTTGVYSVASVTDSTISIQLVAGSGSTTGTANIYPNTMRLFLFNPSNGGTRTSGDVSWAISGY